MSNLRDCLSERNVDSRPSTSHVPVNQPFRSKVSNHTKFKENKDIAAAKKLSKQASSRQQQPEVTKVVSTQTFTNSSTDEISAQVGSLNLNNDDELVNQGDSPKKKNAKKKAKSKLKKLQLPTPNVKILETQTSKENTALKQEMTSIHDLYMHQLSPLYASTSSKYIENLSHLPQYKYMHALPIFQNGYYGSTPPNTPIAHHMNVQNINSNVSPISTLGRVEPTSPRYLQNVLQHPLLSQSFCLGPNHIEQRIQSVNIGQINAQSSAAVSQESLEKNPRCRKRSKKKEQENEDKQFEPYILAEEVEAGLKNNTLLEGVLRINPKQFQHAYVSSTDRSEQDILIDGIKNRNRALEGDVVIVELLVESEDEPESNEDTKQQKKGKVVYIKERVHTRTCIGTLKLMPDKNRQKALFIPRDHRVPRLNIPFTSWPDNFYNEAKNYENTLFLAKIFDWFDIRFALAKIVCHIGQSGDIQSETKAILAQTDLDVTPFGPEVRDLYPRLDYTIPEEEIRLREDCRKLCIFSIDPFNCRDIDDAVSCIQLENGNYEIGVHISDVAHFLTENTLLDEKVSEKATTIYLVEKAYHMLPDDLCMLCSLFPGVDKLAFSVFWEITEDAKVLSHRFSKTVINSCCQLAYDHAQAILEDKEDAEDKFPELYNGFQYQDVYKTIKTLGKIAAILRKNRFDGGALRIDQPKVSFHLNVTDGLPDSFWIYESKESHQLIEEFMLLANMTVAQRLYDDHPKLAFLRCHPPPSGYMLKQLAKSLKPMGIELSISSAGDLHHSLLPHVGPDSTDRGKAMVLNMLCAKPMTRAKYFCAGGYEDEDMGHYALNVPLYTHFTSPIRRYADIMVHRLLASSLKYREVPKWEVDKVRSIAANCNKQKYNAKKAGELSTELYTLKYIEMNSPLVTEAVVVEVRERYIDIIIVCMGLNRRIFFNNDFPGEFKCIKNKDGIKLSKMELTWHAVDGLPKKRQVIEVFSILQVELHKGDEMVKVETKLIWFASLHQGLSYNKIYI